MRIGFTGHRPNRLLLSPNRIRARLGEALEHLVSEAGAISAIVAISPLAEGSDRLFAEVSLDHGIRLEALLPMPASDYIQTFEDEKHAPAFRALLARAENVKELDGSLSDSKAAYEALGRAMVDACDVLVTVWDGMPAAGRGGTPEVIEYALSRGRRVIWIDAATDWAAVQLQAISPRIDTTPLVK